jgi:hypothetical protein
MQVERTRPFRAASFGYLAFAYLHNCQSKPSSAGSAEMLAIFIGRLGNETGQSKRFLRICTPRPCLCWLSTCS